MGVGVKGIRKTGELKAGPVFSSRLRFSGLWSQAGSKLMQFSAMHYTVSTLKGALAGA